MPIGDAQHVQNELTIPEGMLEVCLPSDRDEHDPAVCTTPLIRRIYFGAVRPNRSRLPMQGYPPLDAERCLIDCFTG